MDKQRKKNRFPLKSILSGLILTSFIAFFVWQMMTVDKHPTVYAEKNAITTAVVTRAGFQEYVNVTGVTAPSDSLYVDALESGQVKEIYVEVGGVVKKGEPVLLMENTDLEMEELLKEARIVEKEHELKRTEAQCAKIMHGLAEDLVDLDFRLTRLDKQYRRNVNLVKSNYIAKDEFEEIEDNYHYWKQKRTLLLETTTIEKELNVKTIQQIQAGLDLLKTDHEKTKKRLEEMLLEAPVTGLLTSLDASVGESKNKGARIGRIDLTEEIKVIAGVDEYYAGRVFVGNTATMEIYDAELNINKIFDLNVVVISPDIKGNEFEVEFAFTGVKPEAVRLGQSFTVRLALGREYDALVLRKGPFVQNTGGSWVYVIDEKAGKGVRRNIKIGKHNPDYFEVLEGLTEGETVIISFYDNFGGADAVELN